MALVFPALLFPGTLFFLQLELPLSETQRNIVFSGISQLVNGMLVAWFLGAVLFSIIGLYHSYQYAGPLRRFEAWCDRQIERKKTGPMISRSGDDLGEVAHLLNKLMKSEKS